MRRQRFVVLALVALLGAACSDGEGTSATSVSVETSAAEPASTSAAPVIVETTPDTGAAASAAALVPEVCWGPRGAYFGFDNQSAAPVVVPEGTGNRLDGGPADDNPLRTTLFSPGRTAFAFWVIATEPPPIVWTLTGPDGVERSATADETTPQCAGGVGEPSDADPRLAGLEVSDEAITPAGDSVSLTVTVTGVPDLSICNSAFTAEQVGISLDAATLPTRPDGTRSFTLPLRPANSRPSQLASVQIVANVVDRCSFEGLTVSSWPITQPFTTLGMGIDVCAWVDESGVLSVELTPGLCDMGVTGGTRNRPG